MAYYEIRMGNDLMRVCACNEHEAAEEFAKRSGIPGIETSADLEFYMRDRGLPGHMEFHPDEEGIFYVEAKG